MTSRRTFLKTGLLGGIVLAGAGMTYRAIKGPAPLLALKFDADAQTIVGAIAACLLKGSMSDTAEQRAEAARRTQKAISGLTLHTQNEVRDLLSLLSLAPTRRLLTGITQSWQEATPDEIATFLERWRTSRLNLLQSGYHALHDLILGAWYGDESSWAAIGYPGPLPALAD